MFRFFFGKNRVMSLALGRNRSDEHRPGLRKIARRVQGQTGLLFTNASEPEVLRFTFACIVWCRRSLLVRRVWRSGNVLLSL